MNKWVQIPDNKTIDQVVEALAKNNIETFVFDTIDEARDKFFELIPTGSEVFTNLSTTLDQAEITNVINESGKYVSIKNKVAALPAETPEEKRAKKMIGSAPEYAVGSVHAITKDGKILIASGSGSQLPGYAYGADYIVWMASANKIVENIDEGIKRIYEYTLPLESERMNKVLNITTGSNPRRILIFNSENDMNKNRTKLILVKKILGF